ncbi:MAG: DUF2490 domain-containing protein [Flavobacteriales bacterium]|nr:DUF2490 domain-containing protein [Flavobacteriales bacterium]
MSKSLGIQFAIIIAALIISPLAKAQKTKQVQVRDLEAWGSTAIKWEATKKFSLELEEQFRLKEDASQTDLYFTQLGVSYKINKHFDVGFSGRYITENDNQGKKQGYNHFFRYNIDVSYKHKLQRFGLKYRLRYQNKNELGVSELEGDYPDTRLRFMTAIDYNIKKTKWTPSVAAELFRKDRKGEPVELDKFRLTVGMDYEFKKMGELGFFYRMERDLNATYPKTTNILGLGYKYTIKRKKEKKDKEEVNTIGKTPHSKIPKE